MKEHDFFKKMIYDHAINDAYIKARTKYATPRGFAWRKAVSFAAAAFVVLVGTVFLIPSARAEVLSWFGVSTPQDYLTTDPEQRTEIPEIESLITSPETTDGFKLIPIDRTDSKAVNSEGARCNSLNSSMRTATSSWATLCSTAKRSTNPSISTVFRGCIFWRIGAAAP